MTSEDDGMDWLDEAAPARDPARDELASVAAAARLDVFNLVRGVFDHEASHSQVTRKKLAQRMGVSSALVSRWLLRPSNMTIETAAKLLFLMGREFRFSAPAPHARQGERRHMVFWQANEIISPKLIFNVAFSDDHAKVFCAPQADEGSVTMVEDEQGASEVWISGISEGVDGLYRQNVRMPAASRPRIVGRPAARKSPRWERADA